MQFDPYILDSNGNRVPVTIAPMSKDDAKQTDAFPKWQTSWMSDFITDSDFDCYAVKNDDELIALGAYEIQKGILVVYIVYMESHPESNPTLTHNRKYTGIGKLLIALGIKLSVDNGFGGDVVLRAKTSSLEKHYINDYGAVKLPSYNSAAPRYLIADEAAKQILLSYLR